jgi:hypothetical protein
MDAIVAGYDAFRRSELEGVQARQEQLREAGERLIKASGTMAQALETLKAAGAADKPAIYNALDAAQTDAFNNWLSAQKAPLPKSVYELYERAVLSTKGLGEQILALSERDDDDVFADFVRETSSYLEAAATGSRIFEASPP